MSSSKSMMFRHHFSHFFLLCDCGIVIDTKQKQWFPTNFPITEKNGDKAITFIDREIIPNIKCKRSYNWCPAGRKGDILPHQRWWNWALKDLDTYSFFLSHVIPMEETRACLSRCDTVGEFFFFPFLPDDQYRKAGEARRLAQTMIWYTTFNFHSWTWFLVHSNPTRNKRKKSIRILPSGK